MPYFWTSDHPDCDGVAVVKEEGEIVFCHRTQQEAIDHHIALSLAEDLTPGGEYEGETFRALRDALGGDKYTTEQEALDRAEQLGCEGTHSMDENGQTIYMPCSTHGRYEELTGATGYRSEHDDASTPAPPEDQIEGSDTNEPGSASGAGNDIELSERVEASLRNKVREHNEAMEEDGRPDWTRTTIGQLRAVYRRGAGAYSTSHRPGISRAAWAMARVNAYLYLLRNGKPESANYITDNDLLPEDHPKSTRSLSASETRDVDLTPPAYMRAAFRKGVELYEEGLAGDGVTEQTIREARAGARGSVTADKWSRIGPWIARHLTDLEAESNQPGGEGFPGPGAVAFYLWGATPTQRGATRTQEYAENITRMVSEENEGRVKGDVVNKMETRTFSTDFEVREEGDGMTFTGYAALFNEPSHPLPFIERIAPGAFKRSLKSRNNIFLFNNHNSDQILASTRSGTLRLSEDSRGLRVEATIANTSIGRDVAELVRTGIVGGMSFGFSVPSGGDEWNTEGTERTLKSVRLMEVSVTAMPAYESTNGTATVRGLDRLAIRSGVDADALADALVKLETGEEISDDDKTLLSTVIDTLSPKSEAEPEEAPSEPTEDDSKAMLELKKKKLAALMKEMI